MNSPTQILIKLKTATLFLYFLSSWIFNLNSLYNGRTGSVSVISVAQRPDNTGLYAVSSLVLWSTRAHSALAQLLKGCSWK